MYGAWIEGSTDEDIAAIKRSMEAGPTAAAIHGATPPAVLTNPLPGATNRGVGKAKLAENKEKQWRSGRDSNPRPPDGSMTLSQSSTTDILD
jgi:hypothetical protein